MKLDPSIIEPRMGSNKRFKKTKPQKLSIQSERHLVQIPARNMTLLGSNLHFNVLKSHRNDPVIISKNSTCTEWKNTTFSTINQAENSKQKAFLKCDERNLKLYAVETATCNKALRRIKRQAKPSDA